MEIPRELSCDQCGQVAKVVQTRWKESDDPRILTCEIECENCGKRDIVMAASTWLSRERNSLAQPHEQPEQQSKERRGD